MQVAWNETGAGALYFVGARLERLAGQGLRNDRGILRFDGDGLKRSSARFDGFVAAGNCASGSDRRDENIDFPGRIVPDPFSRGFAMNLRVRRIIKLLDPGVGS